MAHNIYKDSIFTVKEPAWHGIGKVLEHCPTSEEAIILAGLNYEVTKGQAYVQYQPDHRGLLMTQGKEKNGSLINNTYFTYRVDTLEPLCKDGNAVTDAYQVIQNREAFTFFDSIVGEEKAMYETAGVLGIGECIFITVKLSNMFNIGKGDDISSYLLLTMRHDGLGAIISMITPVRVVCNNTLNVALDGKQSRFNIKHTPSAKSRLEEAAKLYKYTLDTMNNITEIYQLMSKVKITYNDKVNYINQVFLTSKELTDLALTGTNHVYKVSNEIISTKKINMIKDVLTYSETGAGQELETAKGTVWGAYNAITGYYQNVKQFNTDGGFDAEKKFKTNILGNNYNIMNKALCLGYELTK